LDAFGVMIVRADLAVECGFDLSAELESEVLWICEAAHVPVVRAVLALDDSRPPDLEPSRPRTVDAAMSARAECVMVDTSPDVVETIAFLDGVLEHVQARRARGSSAPRHRAAAGVAPPQPFDRGDSFAPADGAAAGRSSGTNSMLRMSSRNVSLSMAWSDFAGPHIRRYPKPGSRSAVPMQ
jgi:hypothetical protein